MKSIRSVICFCLFLFVFNQLLFADKTIENDSLYGNCPPTDFASAASRTDK